MIGRTNVKYGGGGFFAGINISTESTAETSLTQFSYYATSSNRIKKCGDSRSADIWWERSPYSGYSNYFCLVNSAGSAYSCYDSISYLLPSFGCIASQISRATTVKKNLAVKSITT